MGIPLKNKFYKCMFHSPIEALSKDAISSGMVPSSPAEQIMVCLFRIQIISNVSAHATGSLSGPFSVHILFTFCKFHERFMQIGSFTNFLYKYICRSCLLALPKIDVRLHLMIDTPNVFINNHRERFMRKPCYTLEMLHQLCWMSEAHLKCWGKTYQRSGGIWLTSPSLLSVYENMNNF